MIGTVKPEYYSAPPTAVSGGDIPVRIPPCFTQVRRTRNTALTPAGKQLVDDNLLKKTRLTLYEGAKFWHEYRDHESLITTNAPDFARYCQFNVSSFNTILHEYRTTLLESQKELSAEASQWLKQTEISFPANVDTFATFFLANQSQIESLHINITHFARHCGIKPETLRRNPQIRRYFRENSHRRQPETPPESGQPVTSLTSEEQAWFSSLQNQHKVTAVQVARCCLPHLSLIQSRDILTNIARDFAIVESTLVGIINQFKRYHLELSVELSADAREWLDNLILPTPITNRSMAEYYLQNLATFSWLGINPSHVARHFKLNFMSFNRGMVEYKNLMRYQYNRDNSLTRLPCENDPNSNDGLTGAKKRKLTRPRRLINSD